jgi:ribosomal protein L1
MADSKRKRAAREKVEAGRAYEVSEALVLVKELATAKFPPMSLVSKTSQRPSKRAS